MSASPIVHLRLHSEYDVQKSVARLGGADSVVEYAAQLGQPALALTDNGCLFGAIKFYQECRRRGIKPIIGCELKVDERNDYYLLLLCASREGYVNLNRLLSRAYAEGNGCVRPAWMTAETTAGIIALSGGARGDIGAAIDRARPEMAERRAREWQARFPDRFYIEVWRDTLQDNNRAAAAADIGQRLGLPVAATHPVQCTRPDDAEILNIKLCIAAGQRSFDPRRPRPMSDAPHLLSDAEMRERFADLPGALDNSAEIAKRCNFAFEFDGAHLPSLPQQGARSSADLLQQEAAAGLDKKLPATLAPDKRREYEQRLEYELGVINAMKFADYFLIVMDFIRWAKENGIPVGPGRGSGAGSLTAYALDITTLDPLDYDLLFERFLNPERVSMPDFDIDFCVNGRDRVIRYVEQRYGRERVAQIITFGSIGARSAVRDVGRVLGIAYGYCDKLARLIPGAPKMTVALALKESEEFAAERETEEGKRLINLALRVEGLPRNIGTHAGGVLIAPRPMEEFCPKYAAADTNTLVSHYDMSDIEKVGLVKFDFLGLRTLTILADAEAQVRRQEPAFSLETLPLQDDATYALYGSGATIGVFQCESHGMRELMRNLKPDRFTDLIALVALYRPGPLNAGMDKSYIDRKHGREDVSYPHDSLRSVLADTYGLFIYQEQVMEIARRISGYSLGEADILRRAMGKKDEKQMRDQRERFLDGSDGKLPRREAESLFDNMAKFAEYGFNKSHAAAYALLSYRTAYIKAHYPAIFLSAVMSAEADNSDRVELMVNDAKRGGIRILPPDINDSDAHFCAVDAKTIRFGLAAIKGVGGGVVQLILDARAGKPFADLFDFCARVGDGVPAAALELLVQAGAFGQLHGNRNATLMTVPSALARDANAGLLFVDGGGGESLADAEPWTLRETLEHEHRVLGFPLTAEFIDLYKHVLPQLPLTWKRLADADRAEQATVAGVVQRVIRYRERTVLLLQDGSGEMEVQVTADMLRALGSDDLHSDLIIARGKVGRRFRGAGMTAASAQRLSAYLATRLSRVVIDCAPTLSADTLAESLPRNARAKVPALLRCRDGDITYDIDLGAHWSLTREAMERLVTLDGVRGVKLDFLAR